MKDVDNTKELTAISLCSGMLGIERGIKRTGIEVRPVAYVEREAFVCFNLVSQMESGLVDSAPIWSDVTTFDGQPFRNKVHGIIGGYPCQGESNAGLRQLESDPRYLWPHIERIIREVNPLFCFFENVEGHITGTFKYVLRSLRALGFTVEAGLFSAAEVGAPHQRKRIFILACADLGELRRCLADANLSKRNLSNKSERNEKASITQSSNLLGDSMRERLPERNVRREASRTDEPFQGSELSRTNAKGVTMANPNSQRGRESSSILQPNEFDQISQKWPARPGYGKEEWEAPRTVESGLGCTVNGYNFRTDLLRMYGNGVVEQTAEVAFRELIRKLFFNLVD